MVKVPLAAPVIPAVRDQNFWQYLMTWDAADNALQALRFSLLLMHVHARLPQPVKLSEILLNPTGYVASRLLSRQKQRALGRGLLVSTEAVANVRRLSLLMLWAYTCYRDLSQRVRRGEETDKGSESAVEQFASISELTDHLGESFDVMALISGSGLFWRALGMPLAVEPPPWIQRRRRGLERMGVFVSLAALVLQLYTVHLRRQAITRAMNRNVRSMQEEVQRIDAPGSAPPPKQLVAAARGRVEDEYKAFASQRRRLRWLGIERLCLYSDLLFAILETWAPDEDKEMVEASTGLFSAVLRLLRVWNEMRFGALDI